MVILRKLALRVQANLGAHSSKIKNAASLLETTFEPFNFHRDTCGLHHDSSSVRAPAGASGGTAFNVRSPPQHAGLLKRVGGYLALFLPLIPACFNPNGSDKLVLAGAQWPL